jgi:hypothetical protein
MGHSWPQAGCTKTPPNDKEAATKDHKPTQLKNKDFIVIK